MRKFLILFLLIPVLLPAQTPVITPAFFTADQEITITYDVTGTSLQNLNEAWIWMWLPDQSIDAPSNINPASTNTSATDQAKFQKTTTQDGRTQFVITLTLTEFFNRSSEEITNIGMILKGNDWSNGQTSDFLTTTTTGFTLALIEPSGNFGFYEPNDIITISAASSEPADLQVLIDDNVVKAETGVSEINFEHPVISDGLVHTIKVNATSGQENDSKSFPYTITPNTQIESIPENSQPGINYRSSTEVTLVLEAPGKEHVFVIGDFNDWSISSDFLMKRDGDLFWLTLDNLDPTGTYQFQYLVDGDIRIADPYTERISSQFDDPQVIAENRYPGLTPYPGSETQEAISYIQMEKPDFQWASFTRPQNEDLIIYELLIRDFTEERTYQAVTDRLDYLADLGINALQLMPVQEFEGNISWGYNPSSMFAVDKFYGTELDLKTLIDEAHKRGMAVILDIVLNHQFGRNSLVRLYNDGTYGPPTPDNPWFNVTAKHDFNVGYDMNHESQYTKDYVDRVVTYWLDEYNVDGYRFDLSKGFTQNNSLGNIGLWNRYDPSRVALLKRMADVIWQNDESAYIILEHFAENDEEKELASYGMMLWGNMHGTYITAGKARSVSLSSMSHINRGWDKPHLIGYKESHDEERFMWELTKSGLSTEEALDRARVTVPFLLLVPGPKMIWQFGEFGYDLELNNDRLGIKPTKWEYLEEESRKRLFNLYKSLTNLRTKTDFVKSEYFSWNPGARVKSIKIEHPDVSILVYGNFDDETQTTNIEFTEAGTWYNYFTGTSFDVDALTSEMTFRPGQFVIYTSENIDNYIEEDAVLLNAKPSEKEYTIYPNPTNDKINVSNVNAYDSYQILNVTGQILEVGDFQKKQTLSLKELPSGSYLIKIFNSRNDIVSTTRIIRK